MEFKTIRIVIAFGMSPWPPLSGLWVNVGYMYLNILLALKCSRDPIWRGIRGTQVEPYIQDIVDEVAPIKEAPLWG